MKKILVQIILIINSFLFAQNNLIKNGEFDNDTREWRGDAATISNYDKVAGKGSAIINQFTGEQWKGIDQIVNIPDETYAIEFSVWIKTNAIEGGENEYNAGVFTVEFTTKSETSIQYENIAQIKGTSNWIEYKKLIIVPAKSKKFRIMLALAQTNGTILFDNVKAIPLKLSEFEEYQNQLQKIEQAKAEKAKQIEFEKTIGNFQNGDFELKLQGWRGDAKIESGIGKENSSALKISSTVETWSGIDQIAKIPEGTRKIKFSGWLRANELNPGKESWNNGVFIVELTKDGTQKVSEDQLIGSISGSTDWTFFEKTLFIPRGTKFFRIMLALSNATGELFADDVKVEFLTQ